MTRSKDIAVDLRPNTSNATVSYGDKTRSIIMGLAEVVLTRDVSLINVKLVETLLFVHQLGFTGLATCVDFVILLWSKTPKRCFLSDIQKRLRMWLTFHGIPLQPLFPY
jgi:hypothetical protein